MKEILLSNGMFAIVDDEDYDRLFTMGKWHCNCKGYATKTIHTRINKKRTSKASFMHRLLVEVPLGMLVDHINGNKLDNRKENLRVCTNSENLSNRGKNKNNTSGYKGVTFHAKMNKWKAKIQVKMKHIHIGYFDCPIKAAKAYNESAVKHQGHFAKLNEI